MGKDISPEMCVNAGKCLIKENITQISEEDYKKLSDDDKDIEDEKEMMSKEEKPEQIE